MTKGQRRRLGRRLKRDAKSLGFKAFSGTSNFLGRQGSRAVAATGKLRRGVRTLGRATGFSDSEFARGIGKVSNFSENKLRKATGMLDEDIKNKRERVFDSCVINIFVTGDLVYVKSRSENNINKWIYSAAYVVDGTHPYYNVKYMRTGWQRPEKFIVKGIKYENMYWIGWARDRFISAKTLKIGMRMARMSLLGGLIPFAGPIFDSVIENMGEAISKAMDMYENPELLGDSISKKVAEDEIEKQDTEKDKMAEINLDKRGKPGDMENDNPIWTGRPGNNPDENLSDYTGKGNEVDDDGVDVLDENGNPKQVTYVEPDGPFDPDTGYNRLSDEQFEAGNKSVYDNPDYTTAHDKWTTDNESYKTYLEGKELDPLEKVPPEYHSGDTAVPLHEANMTDKQFIEFQGRTDHINREIIMDDNGIPVRDSTTGEVTYRYSYNVDAGNDSNGLDLRYLYNNTGTEEEPVWVQAPKGEANTTVGDTTYDAEGYALRECTPNELQKANMDYDQKTNEYELYNSVIDKATRFAEQRYASKSRMTATQTGVAAAVASELVETPTPKKEKEKQPRREYVKRRNILPSDFKREQEINEYYERDDRTNRKMLEKKRRDEERVRQETLRRKPPIQKKTTLKKSSFENNNPIYKHSDGRNEEVELIATEGEGDETLYIIYIPSIRRERHTTFDRLTFPKDNIRLKPQRIPQPNTRSGRSRQRRSTEAGYTRRGQSIDDDYSDDYSDDDYYYSRGGGDASEGGKTKAEIEIYPYIPLMPLCDENSVYGGKNELDDIHKYGDPQKKNASVADASALKDKWIEEHNYLHPEVILETFYDYMFMISLFGDLSRDPVWLKRSPENIDDYNDYDSKFDIKPSSICVRLLSCNEKPSSSIISNIMRTYKTGNRLQNESSRKQVKRIKRRVS